VGNTIAASFCLNFAIAFSSCTWISIVPLRIGDPAAPSPYWSSACLAASMTSG
jgi:hypothetical protein